MKIRRVPLIGMQIRSLHPYRLRVGEWASIVGIVCITEGAQELLCWHVGYDDGGYDHWAISEQYEFRDAA